MYMVKGGGSFLTFPKEVERCGYAQTTLGKAYLEVDALIKAGFWISTRYSSRRAFCFLHETKACFADASFPKTNTAGAYQAFFSVSNVIAVLSPLRNAFVYVRRYSYSLDRAKRHQ